MRISIQGAIKLVSMLQLSCASACLMCAIGAAQTREFVGIVQSAQGGVLVVDCSDGEVRRFTAREETAIDAPGVLQRGERVRLVEARDTRSAPGSRRDVRHIEVSTAR